MKLYNFLHTILILTAFSFSFSFAQNNDSTGFETDYRKILDLMNTERDSLSSLLYSIEMNHQLSDVQRSKMNYLKTKVFAMDVEENRADVSFNHRIDYTINKSLLITAVNRIMESRTSTGIPLLQEYIATADPNSDSADYATIYLAEGYRKIGDYQKGLDILKTLLKKELSRQNLAFACNRMAALYNEYIDPKAQNRLDSVFKYSNLCIHISEKNGYVNHLATAQNELGFYYQVMKDFSRALELYGSAFNNFMKTGQLADAINAKYNTARVFSEMKKFSDAIAVLMEAEKLSKENTGTNIFTKIYIELARNYHELGRNNYAYEYLNIARKMQVDAFKANIRANIYDMSAKYEAEKKEKENLKLRMDNEIKEIKLRSKNATIDYLITGILFIAALLAGIIFLYFQKKKALGILVQRNLELVNTEKEFGIISEHLLDLSDTKDSANKSITGRGEEKPDLITQLENYMKNEKPYLFSDISITDIGQKLNSNRTYISKLINDYYKMNFNDYINEHRIKTARQLLADPTKKHVSIEGIGQMSGFKSRTTFFTCFKKYTGISPSYFRDSIK